MVEEPGRRTNYRTTLALIAPHGNNHEPPQPIAQHDTAKPKSDAYTRMDINEFRAFIQELRDAVQKTSFKDKIMVVDPSTLTTKDKFETEIKDFFAYSPPVAELMLQSIPFNNKGNGSPRTIKPNIPMSDQEHGHAYLPTFEEPIFGRVPHIKDNQSYGAVAFPLTPEETFHSEHYSRYSGSHLPDIRAVPHTSQWGEQSTTFMQRFTATHELAHTMTNPRVEHGETISLAKRRGESTADIASILYLAQRGEPDLERQVQMLIQRRDLSGATPPPALVNNSHNTAEALREMVKDLPRLREDPNFSKMNIEDLTVMAEGYAKKGLQKYYPHLYQKESDRSSSFSPQKRTEEIDTQLRETLRPDTIMKVASKEQAMQLIRMSESLTSSLGRDDNDYSRAVERLRALSPDVFKKAEDALKSDPHNHGTKHTGRLDAKNTAPVAHAPGLMS